MRMDARLSWRQGAGKRLLAATAGSAKLTAVNVEPFVSEGNAQPPHVQHTAIQSFAVMLVATSSNREQTHFSAKPSRP